MNYELIITAILFIGILAVAGWYAIVVLPEIQFYNEHLITCNCTGLCRYGRYIPAANNSSWVMAVVD